MQRVVIDKVYINNVCLCFLTTTFKVIVIRTLNFKIDDDIISIKDDVTGITSLFRLILVCF